MRTLRLFCAVYQASCHRQLKNRLLSRQDVMIRGLDGLHFVSREALVNAPQVEATRIEELRIKVAMEVPVQGSLRFLDLM